MAETLRVIKSLVQNQIVKCHEIIKKHFFKYQGIGLKLQISTQFSVSESVVKT